jgi:urea transporter
MQAWGERADGNPLLAFVDSCLRGVGQVCFMNNPVTGLAILVAMFVAEGWLGFAGVLGVVASTAAAGVIGMDGGAIRAGLFGFYGVLVGAGMSLFLQPDWDEMVIVWIVVGAMFSTILHAALANIFVGIFKVPPFTLAFNFMTLIFLLGALNFANGRVGGLVAPADAQVTSGSVSNTLRSAADAASANNVEGILNAIFRGIGQLFFANSLWAGIIIIAGLAVCSRIAAVFAVVGGGLGGVTRRAGGAHGGGVYNGRWGV